MFKSSVGTSEMTPSVGSAFLLSRDMRSGFFPEVIIATTVIIMVASKAKSMFTF